MTWLTRLKRWWQQRITALDSLENRIYYASLLCGGLPSLIVLVLLLQDDDATHLLLLMLIFLLCWVLTISFNVKNNLNFSYRTLVNLLEALVKNDHSMRGKLVNGQDGFSESIVMINKLADEMAKQSLESREKQLLLEKVTLQIDLAVFAIDRFQRVSFVNPTGLKLLKCESEDVLLKSVDELGLQPALSGNKNGVCVLNLGGVTGKFHAFCDHYFEEGRTYTLLFLSDLQLILLDEERQAWQRLLRVLGHEINNSMSPITTISETLVEMAENPPSEGFNKKVVQGASVMLERGKRLISFINSYSTLTYLAKPDKSWISIKTLFSQLVPLFTERQIQMVEQEDMRLFVDVSQIQQLLLNLLKNAHEAMAQPDGVIEVRWHTGEKVVHIEVLDSGSGISNSDNLFVPFYSTKGRNGGIGLALCRQISFNHNGRLSLTNRKDKQGAIATLSLPLSEQQNRSDG